MCEKEVKVIVLEAPEEKPREEMHIHVGCGWSANNDEGKAVEEAVSSVKTELGGKSPDFAVLFSTASYDSDKVLSDV